MFHNIVGVCRVWQFAPTTFLQSPFPQSELLPQKTETACTDVAKTRTNRENVRTNFKNVRTNFVNVRTNFKNVRTNRGNLHGNRGNLLEN